MKPYKSGEMLVLHITNVCLIKIRSKYSSNTLSNVFTTNFYETGTNGINIG